MRSQVSPFRLYLLFGIVLLAGGVIATRLFVLQIVQSDFYSALAKGQKVALERENYERGSIYLQDSRAAEESNHPPYFFAALNKTKYLVYVVPDDLKDEAKKETVAFKLSPYLEMESDVMKAVLGSGQGQYLMLKDNLGEETAKAIKAADIPGVFLRSYRARLYPGESLGAHILGFLGFRGDKRTGQYGLEEYYDRDLRGGEPFFFGNGDNLEKRGANLELTIDYNVQFQVEQKLHEVFSSLHAEDGSAIVMNPKTGEIIAMASEPLFNPNKYSEEKDIGVFLNTAIQKILEPGSIFKPFVMAAGIDAGVISPNTTYFDKGSLRIDGYTIKNSDLKEHGTQTMTQVIEKSLNTGAVFVEEKLGKKRFRDYLRDFRIGVSTGIDLAGEVGGDIVNILETNRDINFATASFGQGIAVTPINIISSFSALANGGAIMKPHLVKSVHFADGRIEKVAPEELARPISAETADTVTKMLVSAVQNGYSRKAGVPGYKVAGKTGTAQIPVKNGKGYAEGESLHSFIGYAPAEDPAFIIFLSLKNPKGINFSSESLAPVFANMAAFILQYYQISSGAPSN